MLYKNLGLTGVYDQANASVKSAGDLKAQFKANVVNKSPQEAIPTSQPHKYLLSNSACSYTRKNQNPLLIY